MSATALVVATATGLLGLWFGFTVGAMWATWTAERKGQG